MFLEQTLALNKDQIPRTVTLVLIPPYTHGALMLLLIDRQEIRFKELSTSSVKRYNPVLVGIHKSDVN